MITYTPSSVWHASADLPDDGDAFRAANIDPPHEAALDNSLYLKTALKDRTDFRLFFEQEYGNDGSSLTQGWTASSFGTDDVALATIDVEYVKFDIVEIEFWGHGLAGTAGHGGEFRIATKEDSGSLSLPTGARAKDYYPKDGVEQPFSIGGVHYISTNGILHLTIYLQGRSIDGSPYVIGLFEPWKLMTRGYRRDPLP